MTHLQETSVARTPLSVEVRKAENEDIDTLSQVLARAFDDDPFANWLVLHDDQRDQRLIDGFKGLLKHNSGGLAHTYTTTEHHGAAIWKAPGHWQESIVHQLAFTPSLIRIAGWRRVPTLFGAFNFIEKKHKEHVPEPHWYLSILGVDTEFQGRGVGGQLMAPVLEICDRGAMPAYLETAKDINVPFYEKHGFKIVDETDLPGDGPKVWLMKRPPA
jgi:ribosomal protein S18 acetylase RimI-like enzyme